MLMKAVKVTEVKNGGWHWFFGRKDLGDIEGKYLFFSSNFDKLKEVALHCLTQFPDNFWEAKISIEPGDGGEHVLCVYAEQNEMQDKMVKVAEKFDVKIPKRRDGSIGRFWKSDAETLAGNYYCKTHRKYHTIDKGCEV